MALFSPTSDALIFYRKIAEDSKKHLNKNGLLFLEINQKLGSETLDLYRNDFEEAALIKDLSENDRCFWKKVNMNGYDCLNKTLWSFYMFSNHILEMLSVPEL
jgi:methylase of polypeptide subunit release factors